MSVLFSNHVDNATPFNAIRGGVLGCWKGVNPHLTIPDGQRSFGPILQICRIGLGSSREAAIQRLATHIRWLDAQV